MAGFEIYHPHDDIVGTGVALNDYQFEQVWAPRGWLRLPVEGLPEVDPDDMSKDDLLTEAKDRKVEVPAGATKDEIATAINDAAPPKPDPAKTTDTTRAAKPKEG